MAGETPKIKSISCPHCGAPATIRGLGFTTTLACASCGSTIDISGDEYAILRKGGVAGKEPLIPIGTRCRFFGDTFEVIGYLTKSTKNEWGTFGWEEYLLFNPYKGFRWLVQSEGHWSFVRMLKQNILPSATKVTYDKNHYKLFSQDKAVVEYVLGEFYWEVAQGDTVTLYDFIDPPYALSYEREDSEASWSQGVYLSEKEMRAAFPNITRFPSRHGVGSHQPFPITHPAKYYLTAAAAVIFAWMVHGYCMGDMKPGQIQSAQHQYQPASSWSVQAGVAPSDVPSLITEPPFHLATAAKNIVVTSTMQGSNRWLENTVQLVNATTGEKVEGTTEMSFYEGRDSDGYWSEGSPTQEIWFPSVAAGEYYLTIEPSSDIASVTQYSIYVQRDVSFSGNLGIIILIILLVPIGIFFYRKSFEGSRWENSSLKAGDS